MPGGNFGQAPGFRKGPHQGSEIGSRARSVFSLSLNLDSRPLHFWRSGICGNHVSVAPFLGKQLEYAPLLFSGRGEAR
jgi:hypothetical protein